MSVQVQICIGERANHNYIRVSLSSEVVESILLFSLVSFYSYVSPLAHSVSESNRMLGLSERWRGVQQKDLMLAACNVVAVVIW